MTKDEAMKLALEDVQDMMTTSDWFNERVQAVRQAIDQLPDDTKMIDKVSIKYWVQDTVESGRWVTTESVPKSTAKKLLSDEYRDAFPQGHIVEPPNSTTDVVEPELVAWVLLDLWKTGQHWPDDCFNSEGGEGMTPLYTAPIKRKGWQYAKEREAEVQRLKEIIDELENDDPPPRREWVGLTDEEIAEGARQSWVDKQAFESAVWWAESKLREKNGF